MEFQSTAVKPRFYWQRLRCAKRVRSRPKSLRGAGLCLRGLVLAVLGRSSGFERAEQASRNAGDFIDGSVEGRFVWLRRLVEAADFSEELEGGGLGFFLRSGGRCVGE